MLEDNALLTRIVSRFHIIVTVVVAMLGAAFLGISAGEGDFFGIYVSIFTAAFVAIMIALGDKYWMVVPFAFTSQLPAIPIKGRLLELPEITAVLCTAVFLVRYAVKRQNFSVFRREHALILLYTGWVVMIFCMNPVGLSDAGASLGGARFYAKIVMALASFLIMANQVITEIDCKRIILILIFGSILSSAYQISLYLVPSFGATVQLTGESEFYSWHQALYAVPSLLICLGFARYRSSDLFSLNRVWAIVGFVVCAIVIAASGKRTAIAAVPVFAMSAAFLRREWGFLMVWLAGVLIAATIIVVGHGELFEFPLAAQRAFSFLPAKWGTEMRYMEGGQDLFRAELRRQALLKIEKDPWFGTGYQVNLSLAQALSAQYAARGGDTELQVAPFAMGSAWHNTWLGYAADFGIPLSVVAALIYLSVIFRGARMMKFFPINTYSAALSMYILLFTIRRLAASHAAGHSAEEPFGYWWMFGLQIALFFRRPETQREHTATRSWDPASTARVGPASRGRLSSPGRLPGSPASARNIHN